MNDDDNANVDVLENNKIGMKMRINNEEKNGIKDDSAKRRSKKGLIENFYKPFAFVFSQADRQRRKLKRKDTSH